MITVVLLVVAAVLFALGAFTTSRRVNLTSLGLLFLTLALLIPQLR